MKLLWKNLISLFIIVANCLQQCCLGQSTTVRPYKFGFTINEQQHRSEQKDERGIVMGEFGFITADGIYHVTVYATDEEGRFRILAMKNYPYKSPPETVEVLMKPKTTTSTTTKPLQRHHFHTEACSGCFLGNSNNKPKNTNGIQEKIPKNDIRPLSKPLPILSSDFPTNSKIPKNKTPFIAIQSNQPRTDTLLPTKITTANPSPIMGIIMKKVLTTIMDNKANTASVLKSATIPNVPSSSRSSNDATIGNRKMPIGTSSPSVVSEDGNLYRFKYILDYNGHSETGKRNGNKEGSYYVIGDDDVERTIEYVANEFGYQPRIRWRKINRDEIKSKENTLKDYEFVWFNK